MKCPKCDNRLKVIDTRHNLEDNETYRRLRCYDCGSEFYSGEFEIDFKSIENVWKTLERTRLKMRDKRDDKQRI